MTGLDLLNPVICVFFLYRDPGGLVLTNFYSQKTLTILNNIHLMFKFGKSYSKRKAMSGKYFNVEYNYTS